MNNTPLVSIIIPVYNGRNFMREAIDSALSQTYKNTEIIVINDGSSDCGATEAIALSYGERIRYYTKNNGGVSSALNLALKHMKGDYFSWLSHDDKYATEKIQKEVSLLVNYPNENVVAYCGCQFIDKNSNPLKYRRLHISLSEGRINTWQEALKGILIDDAYNGCAFLIPRRVFSTIGDFDEHLKFNQDMLMWMKLFLHGYGIVYTSYPGVLSRVHNDQLTQKGQDIFRRDCNRTSDFMIHELLKRSNQSQNFLYYYAKRQSKYGNKVIVQKCLDIASQIHLFSCWQVILIHIIVFYGNFRPFIII